MPSSREPVLFQLRERGIDLPWVLSDTRRRATQDSTLALCKEGDESVGDTNRNNRTLGAGDYPAFKLFLI